MSALIRDQYGRFELLVFPLELTPKDFEPWPMETRVLLEMFFARGAAWDASHSVIDASFVAPYRLRGELDDRHWFYGAEDMRIERDNFDAFDDWTMAQEQTPVALRARQETARRSIS